MVFSQILLLIAGAAQTPPSLEFSIAPLQKTYTLGHAIALRCKFKNVTSSTQAVRRLAGDLKSGDFERHPVWVNCHVTGGEAL